MFKRIGFLVLCVFMILCGAGLIEMGITDPDLMLASKIFGGLCGGILILAGVVLIYLEMPEKPNLKKIRSDKASLLKGLRSELGPSFTIEKTDLNDKEKLIRRFRGNYAAFFEKSGSMENSPVQGDVTQIYWHTMYLQKKRLDRKQIRLCLESERLRYGTINPVKVKTFFDGKYQIHDVTEIVQAVRTFEGHNGKRLYTSKSLKSAGYRILNALKQGKDQVICPNCGYAADRENLIDGCDYCGTKFTVEDLGRRIADFGFRTDHEAEYARFRENREFYAMRVGLIVGIPVFILCMIGAVMASGDVDGPYTLRVAATMFAAAFPTFAAVFLAEILFFLFLFPVLQAKASITYYTKRHLDQMKRQAQKNSEAEKRAKTFDPLFSLNGFYSTVQNVLAVIHFADSEKEAAAFADGEAAEAQLAGFIPGYKDLIDMQVQEMVLDDYQIGNGTQKAFVTADLELLSESGGRVRKENETIRLVLVKSEDCRTQAVCAPSFTVCKKCGASISLLDGRTCPVCGYARRLAEADWAVCEYDS